MIEVCPECDTANMSPNNHGLTGTNVTHDYRCANGHTFDEPAKRERKGEWTASTHGLAKELEEMDL